MFSGAALVVVGGLNVEEREIVCVTAPCPGPPVWPKLVIASGIGLFGLTGWLAYRWR